MADKPITFDIIASWSAVSEVMLDAYWNVRRKLYMHGLRLCDIKDDSGWCSVHDTQTFNEDATTCDWWDWDKAHQGAWLKDLYGARDEISGHFRKVAQVADMMVERMCRKCGYVGTPDDVHDHTCEGGTDESH